MVKIRSLVSGGVATGEIRVGDTFEARECKVNGRPGYEVKEGTLHAIFTEDEVEVLASEGSDIPKTQPLEVW